MVYTVAEMIRQQRGGAAVVMGALSPRTRNAQVALYQSGDVDYLVATDAIGMGLNMDVDHVAFAQTRKFDGFQYRNLNPSELAQVAGRAGRYMNDGTFGVTAEAEGFDQEIIDRLENHNFEITARHAMAQPRSGFSLARSTSEVLGLSAKPRWPDPRPTQSAILKHWRPFAAMPIPLTWCGHRSKFSAPGKFAKFLITATYRLPNMPTSYRASSLFCIHGRV